MIGQSRRLWRLAPILLKVTLRSYTYIVDNMRQNCVPCASHNAGIEVQDFVPADNLT